MYSLATATMMIAVFIAMGIAALNDDIYRLKPARWILGLLMTTLIIFALSTMAHVFLDTDHSYQITKANPELKNVQVSFRNGNATFDKDDKKCVAPIYRQLDGKFNLHLDDVACTATTKVPL